MPPATSARIASPISKPAPNPRSGGGIAGGAGSTTVVSRSTNGCSSRTGHVASCGSTGSRGGCGTARSCPSDTRINHGNAARHRRRRHARTHARLARAPPEAGMFAPRGGPSAPSWTPTGSRPTCATSMRSRGRSRASTPSIHTAYRQGDDAWSTNVVGSETVARAAAGVRLVHLSSDLVFDGTIGHYSEEDVPAPVNDYGRSKAEAELRVADAHPGATIVRTSLIYGVPDGPQERLAREGTRFFVDELRSPVQRRRSRGGPARAARARGSRAAARGRRRRRQPLRLRGPARRRRRADRARTDERRTARPT